MNAPSPLEDDSVKDDGSLAATLEEFLNLVKSGRKPSREEFLARHHDQADDLADCLEGLEFVLTAAAEMRPESDGLSDANLTGDAIAFSGGPFAPETRLGDYRIIREVGRGGMGVVYEAEQLSLGRRVALKVLPFAASLDPRQRQRFQLEAQAAGHLHHPHIVPVFAVGRDHGVHYYAMQFIEGQTLATLVRDYRRLAERQEVDAHDDPDATPIPAPAALLHQRTPSGEGSTLRSGSASEGVSTQGSNASTSVRNQWYFRAVARLGAQAASALEHAHALGVIHRDIKPGNLMVDGRGDLYVTDFGLARFLDDPGMTRTGDLLGTLAYMSPEQALGRREVDHRADLYSLGATLYEMLVLRPPFTGRDRGDLLRKISNDDPTRPRKLDPNVPIDLETIVLKAMEKEPSARYATAKDLAEELERFLDDKPIRARRPGVIEHCAKWSRRHRSVVVTALSVMMLAMTVGSILVLHQKQQTERARQDLRANFLNMVKVADTATMEAMGIASAGRAHVGPSGNSIPIHDIFQKAHDFYMMAAQQPQTDDEMRSLVAHANHRLGFTRMIMQLPRGDETFALSVQQYEELMRTRPTEPTYALGLADTLDDWATLISISRGLDASEAVFQRACELRRQTAVQFPVYTGALVNLVQNIAARSRALELAGRTEEARTVRASVLDFAQQLSTALPADSDPREVLARAVVASGKVMIDNDQRHEAEMMFRFALALAPGHDVATNDLAWVLSTRPGGSPFDPVQALMLAQRAVETSPGAGVLWNTLGVAYFRSGDRAKAESAFRRSMELRNGGDPNDWLFLAMCRQDSGDHAEARVLFDKSQGWMARNPTLAGDPDLQSFLREAASKLGLPEPPRPPSTPLTTGTTLNRPTESISRPVPATVLPTTCTDKEAHTNTPPGTPSLEQGVRSVRRLVEDALSAPRCRT
ncbi:MAG: protein kinase [Isosphaeraceae bacterium]